MKVIINTFSDLKKFDIRELKKVLKKKMLAYVIFFAIFIVFVNVESKITSQKENEYYSRANYHLVGNINKVKDYYNHAQFVYEMKLDSMSFIENKFENTCFWGIYDTTAKTVYFMLYDTIKYEKIIVDSKNRIIYDASTGDSITEVYLASQPRREFLEQFENENTIRF